MAKIIAKDGAFVRIQSTKTINVTMGLQNQDVTNADAHVPDRLKVSPLWPKLIVQIKEGVYWYPSEITKWETVKALVKDKILTIGEFANETDSPEVDEQAKKLEANIANVNAKLDKPMQKKPKTQASLSDLANDTPEA